MNSEHLDSALWIPAALNKSAYIGSSLLIPAKVNKWKNVLRSKPGVLKVSLLVSILISLMYGYLIVFLGYLIANLLQDHHYSIALLYCLVALVFVSMFYLGLRDTSKLIFYMFFTKQTITDVLMAEQRKERG